MQCTHTKAFYRLAIKLANYEKSNIPHSISQLLLSDNNKLKQYISIRYINKYKYQETAIHAIVVFVQMSKNNNQKKKKSVIYLIKEQAINIINVIL